ncbi:MAG: 4-hydroxy-3-methylbut-2-enyl diphosphate reductase [Candidatus Omnitrophota bacterium]|nr:4-hydroxy-3-methylbut-2-enyl diphosphate reductase [Candidatus Omnitrophota bacterium]
MRILTPGQIGCCFGVKRAIKLTEETLLNKKPTYIFGELVHNATITRELSKKGLKVVKGIGDVKGGVLIIRAHGISPDERDKAAKLKIEIVDATCPIVRQAQVVAQKLEEEGYQIVIVGDKNHAEIKGILGYLKKGALIVGSPKEVDPKKLEKKVGLIFQTTHSIELCRDVLAEIMKTAHEIKIINTICADIRKRQEDAVELAKKADLMIVVGSHHSSNTIKLKKLCLKYNTNTIQIEMAKDLTPRQLKGVKSVGIIGGASTPDILIEEVKRKLKESG